MAKGIYERKGQHGDVTYYIRYQFQGTDIKEHVGRKSRGFTRATAKKALKSRLGDIARGQFSLEKTRRPVPFSTLLEQYEEYAKTNWRDYNKQKYFLAALGKHFGDTPLSQITSWHIEKWKADLRKTLKPGSVNRHMTVLKHMFKKGVEWGLVKTNPTVGIKRFPEADPRTRYLDEDELERLLSVCKEQKRQPWLLPLVTLAVHTGMRQGELLGLRWSNVDLDRGLITLQQHKTLKNKYIPINEAARESLIWLDKHRYGDHVFMYHWQKPIGKDNVQKAIDRVCSKAGIDDFTFHGTRHTFGSHLVMAGVDLVTVSKLMGHSKINMTMRYAHLAPKHEAEAVAKLNARLAQNRHISETQKQKVIGITEKYAVSTPPRSGGCTSPGSCLPARRGLPRPGSAFLA